MIEHRLIERMLAILRKEMGKIDAEQRVDVAVIDAGVDFIRTYADRTHHGKEEDILFRDMAKKEMAAPDRQMMEDLIAEHQYARQTTGELVEARNKYAQGETELFDVICGKLKALTDFYPGHIEKEDRVFFPAAMRCLSKEEQAAMLAEFWEFDRKMIHEKYSSQVERLESEFK
jgi:hemerythrin-like domain-containing protein